MAKRDIYMVERADIDRLHTRIDDTQKSNQELAKTLGAMAVQITEIATIVKGWPKPKERPCEFFLSHQAEHKEVSDFMVEAKEHLREAKETRNDIRREGIGIVGKIFFYVVGSLLLLGAGAFIQQHSELPKIDVTVGK